MGRAIKAMLEQKAEEIKVPAGAWERVRTGLPVRRPLRSRLWGVTQVAAAVVLVGAVAAAGVLLGPGRRAPEPGIGSGQSGASVTMVGPHRLKEYLVAPAAEIGEDLLKLLDRLPPEAQAHRSTVLPRLVANRVQGHNRVLERFGMKLVARAGDGQTLYDLYRGQELVAGGFRYFEEISVNARGDDFVFVAFQDDRHMMVQAGGVREWPPAEVMANLFIPPVYAGNDLVWVSSRTAGSDRFEIRRGDQTVYSYTHPDVRPKVKRLAALNGKWVLEVDGQLLIEGEPQNARLGYDRIFELTRLRGKPFFFFQKGQLIGADYAGTDLGLQYEQVLNYLCCEYAALNVLATGDTIGFYAKRNGNWYFVVLEVEEIG